MGKQLRYLEIAQIIKERIKNGTFARGESLPSQKELSEIFETSIMTARQALAILEGEGIITVVHGVGTFVAAPALHSDTISLQGFQNEMDRQKLKIHTTIVEKKYGAVKAELNRVFRNEQSEFSCLVRLRTLEGLPVILQRSWVSFENQSVIEEYTADKSLYQLFTERTNIMITLGREIVSPIILGDEELGLLNITEPCPAFHSRRISISLDDKVVLYDEAFLPGPYVMMASSKHGRNNKFKYIIKKDGAMDPLESFNDPQLWEDLK
ncbi:MAG: GntR family transcriptional regulator [Spirochaetales bacterium]|nr:GntR family transcriptional regulator [Spirochaetales bacterium]